MHHFSDKKFLLSLVNKYAAISVNDKNRTNIIDDDPNVIADDSRRKTLLTHKTKAILEIFISFLFISFLSNFTAKFDKKH